MKKTIALASLAVLLFGFSPPVYSQQSQEESESSITGCLNPAEAEGYFVIEDEETGEKTTVTGLDSLARHSNNHKVTVTGSIEAEDGKEVMKVTKVQMLAVCD